MTNKTSIIGRKKGVINKTKLMDDFLKINNRKKLIKLATAKHPESPK